jgi:hypothetical protein
MVLQNRYLRETWCLNGWAIRAEASDCEQHVREGLLSTQKPQLLMRG